MKNTLVLILFSLLFFGCESTYIFNRVVKLSNGDKMLLGGVNREAFLKEPFSEWFLTEYDSYQPNSARVKDLKKKLKNCKIEVFIGTWCGDCKVYYPQFLKILDEAKFPEQRMVTYAVNESKKSFYSEEMGKDIRHVPTFIFYKGGKEIGRIVESPVSSSLEEDILMIVSEMAYTPNHAED